LPLLDLLALDVACWIWQHGIWQSWFCICVAQWKVCVTEVNAFYISVNLIVLQKRRLRHFGSPVPFLGLLEDFTAITSNNLWVGPTDSLLKFKTVNRLTSHPNPWTLWPNDATGTSWSLYLSPLLKLRSFSAIIEFVK
jgi:hypothetical protein